MILMRQRRAEERHDPIAHDLVDRTLIPMDSLHHVLKDWIKEFACIFPITISQQLHGPFHIRKENCDLLALAFERTFGSENFFSEMLWRVGLRGKELYGRRCLS